MKIKLKISRCDPMGKGNRSPFLQAYDVEARDGMTILDALHLVKDEQDGTLAFRRSCRSAICGSCAMNINGFPKLACKTQLITEYKKKESMIIEPLSNHRVIKDLVVDFNPFWDKINKIEPWLNHEATISHQQSAISKKAVFKINNSSKCIMCGCCNGACNTLEIDKHFIAPAALAKAWRFVGDVREGEKKKRLEKLSEDHGMWDCVRCVHCTQYCPKDVAPLQAIERLRAEAMKEGIIDNHGARHVESMVGSVKRVGRLDEAAMTFKTLGFLRSLGMIPFGLKMEMHGKMPMPLIFPQIEKIEEVKKIYEEVEKRKKQTGVKVEK
jgi:succinate dehydrogenase / fumarate reductase iron-sulfur subunit